MMKTTGLDIVNAIQLANTFHCDLYHWKSGKTHKFDDLPDGVFSYEEVVFHEWELKISYCAFIEAQEELFIDRGRERFLFGGVFLV
jgi:hypothetical protein